jgi:hypothetical protein
LRFSHSFLAIVTCLGAQVAGAAPPSLSTGASACWEQDITRTPYPEAARDAAIFDLAGVAVWHQQLSRDISLEFGANAGLESCPKYDGLDRVLGGVQLAVRRKFGLGPYAPAVRAELSYTGSSFRESGRDSMRLDAALSWTKRWGDSWQTVVSGEFMRNDGREHVYDYQNRGLSLAAHYDLTEQWQLSGGVRRQWGEQITYAWLGGDGANFPYVFDIWKNTTDSPTFGHNWSVYTIDAHADSFWFSLSPAIGDNRSLSLRMEQTSVVGRGESYKTRRISLSFVQRF